MEHAMSEMICITCPLGCHLEIHRISATELSVTGNRCARGEAYAKEELLSPRRVVTTTCPASGDAGLYTPRRVPVRSSAPFPKEKIPELLRIIGKLSVDLPVSRGDVLIADALGTGIAIIATRSM